MDIKVEKFVAQGENSFGSYYDTVRNHFAKQYKGIAIIGTEQGFSVEELVTVSIGTTESATTALIKVIPMYWDEGFCTYGKGKAGGYGYHRASAAVERAIFNAGIALDESISGRGDGAITDAVLAITDYVARSTCKSAKILAIDVLRAEV